MSYKHIYYHYLIYSPLSPFLLLHFIYDFTYEIYIIKIKFFVTKNTDFFI